MKRDDLVLPGAVLLLIVLALAYCPASPRQQLAPVPVRENPAILRLEKCTLIDLNRADEEMLTSLDGIGPVLARRIVREREENGPFLSLEALDAVKGIGPRIMKSAQSRVVFLP